MREDYKFQVGFVTKFGKLDISLIENYKEIGDSLLSWMIMLDDEEFEDLRKEVDDLVKDSGNTRYILPLIVHCKGKPIEGTYITSIDILNAIRRIRASFTVISLCRKKLIDYTPNEDDEKWAFFKKDLTDESFERLVLNECPRRN